jgi:hypothetical protein
VHFVFYRTIRAKIQRQTHYRLATSGCGRREYKAEDQKEKPKVNLGVEVMGLEY